LVYRFIKPSDQSVVLVLAIRRRSPSRVSFLHKLDRSCWIAKRSNCGELRPLPGNFSSLINPPDHDHSRPSWSRFSGSLDYDFLDQRQTLLSDCCGCAVWCRWDRPQLHNVLEQLREGEVLVVWKLDRLSRSLKDLLQIMEKVSDAAPVSTCT
jgi:hypothetical protein